MLVGRSVYAESSDLLPTWLQRLRDECYPVDENVVATRDAVQRFDLPLPVSEGQ
jgi:hypothetical protein